MRLYSPKHLYLSKQVRIENGKKGKKMTEKILDINSIDDAYDRQAIMRQLIVSAPAGQEIADQCDAIKELLLRKNIAYGNSALNPIGVFAKQDAGSQIDVRIDDKLNRLKNGKTYAGDDDILDLVGYLVLKLVYERNFKHGRKNGTQA